MSYLEKHEYFCENGLSVGLCMEFNPIGGKCDELFKLMMPLEYGEPCNHIGFWAYDYPDNGCASNKKAERQVYSSTRQNIVLLMAAINNEL